MIDLLISFCFYELDFSGDENNVRDWKTSPACERHLAENDWTWENNENEILIDFFKVKNIRIQFN